MRLGEMLVAQGLVSREDVATALARQRKQGKRLGSHLVAMGALTIEQLAEALARQRELEAAVDACARLLRDLQQRHGDLNPATSQAAYELARANFAAGYTDHALTLGEHVLDRYRRSFGFDDDRTREAEQFVAQVRESVERPDQPIARAAASASG